jgi:hypothetical protein
MTVNFHPHEAGKAAFEAKLIEKTAWFSITADDRFSTFTLFFDPKNIAHIMGQMEKALGELETIAAHLDRDSDAELAPAGVSEQDGVLV